MELGAFLPGHWFDTSRPIGEVLEELVDQAVLAEELGYDTVWFAEHYFNNYVATPAPLQLAAIAGSRTSSIKLGTAVMVLPFHHPLQLASELTQLDVLTEGRVVAAFGRGSYPFEQNQMGFSMTNEENLAYCEESFEVIAKTMRSRMKAVAHSGERWNFENVTLVPPSHSATTPDLWMAAQSATSAKWAVELCVKSGLRPQIFCSQLRRPFSLVEEVYNAFTEALAENGIAREEGTFAINQLALVADTDEEAVTEVFKTIYPLNRGVWNLQGVTGNAVGHVVDGVVSDAPMANEPTREQLIENSLVGSVDTVLAKMVEYRDLGVDHLSLQTNISIDASVVEKSMRLTARHILPCLR